MSLERLKSRRKKKREMKFSEFVVSLIFTGVI
jgi:hypothetical protein